MRFDELNLIEPLLAAVRHEGYEIPTPIQEKAIPLLLEGRDLLGTAQTGTGKTAAFALPILQRLTQRPPQQGKRSIRVLVLTPTRELAAQVGESFQTYGRELRLRVAIVFGGVSQNTQVDALVRGVDILVATPGRLMDLMQQGYISLASVDTFVLDEADRMLDMGFIKDIRQIESHLPSQRQTLMFSATMPWDIRSLADSILKSPVTVSVDPPASTVDLTDQWVCFVEKLDKVALLSYMLDSPDYDRILVFTRTKHGADKVVKSLQRSHLTAIAIHGNKTQAQRTRALDALKSGKIKVLVATDVASRGLDIEGISHVVNFDMPDEPEAYVHRIGRTGRAGHAGVAISFCAVEERESLMAVEKLIQKHIQRVEGHPFQSSVEPPFPTVLDAKARAANVETSRRLGGRGGGRVRSFSARGGVRRVR
jgi:ATP-dependent RNA helicase RhlE